MEAYQPDSVVIHGNQHLKAHRKLAQGAHGSEGVPDRDGRPRRGRQDDDPLQTQAWGSGHDDSHDRL